MVTCSKGEADGPAKVSLCSGTPPRRVLAAALSRLMLGRAPIERRHKVTATSMSMGLSPAGSGPSGVAIVLCGG
jgi:hypothetical protein